MKSFQEYFHAKENTGSIDSIPESDNDFYAEKLVQIRKQVFGMNQLLKELFEIIIARGSSNGIGEIKEVMSALQQIFIDAGNDLEKFLNGIKPINEHLREQIRATAKGIFKI